jgi:hypothetical protein
MPTLTLSQLKQELNSRIQATLLDEVATAVRKVEAESIETYVYDVYEPKEYERRRFDGGLQDPKNMIAEINHNANGGQNLNTLEIFNVTTGKYEPNKYIAGLVEYGDGYGGMRYQPFWGDANTYPYKNPRPFTRGTIAFLSLEKQHVKALKQGLSKRGLKSK